MFVCESGRRHARILVYQSCYDVYLLSVLPCLRVADSRRGWGAGMGGDGSVENVVPECLSSLDMCTCSSIDNTNFPFLAPGKPTPSIEPEFLQRSQCALYAGLGRQIR